MKKITFLLLMLLSIKTFSQVEIVENFDNAPDYDVPAGWSQTGNFTAASYFACGGTGKSAVSGFEFPGQEILTTPNFTAVTNATDLTVSFTVNIFEQGPVFNFPVTYNAPIASWGNLTLEYSIDGGSNWTTAYILDDSNYTYVSNETCIAISAVNLGPLASGSDFQARFVANAVTITPDSGNSLVFVVDNVSITQVATSAPNCNATLLNPTDGSSGANLDATMTWQAATGIPTGYTISIGTTSGGTEILNAATTTDSNYPLAGLGLVYGTEYFVTIVPYNDFGDATGCTEQSFTTRLAPIAGATCSSPLEITSFPYIVANGNTSDYENNINIGPCGGYPGAFMDGYDVFYEITPTTDISIDISLANVSEYAAAIHVVEGCPDTATNCVAFLGDNYSTEPPYNMDLNNVVLLAGHTYFIVLSSGGFDSSFAYSLIIVQNDCISPEFTLTPMGDCAAGQFTVDVDVTYLGDASSLTLTDGFGNSNNSISTTGIVNFGPYPSGSTVELTLTNNDNGDCATTNSTFFYCPPSNDECTNSIALDINIDDSCTLFTSATNAGATESANNPLNCEYTNNNDVWFSFVATNQTLILEYLNVVAAIGDGGTLQSTELLEGNCGAFTSLGCFTSNYVTLSNLTVGNTYYIRNNTRNAGDFAQNYDICLREAPAPPANDECSNATVLTASSDDQCDNQISGTTVGATPSADNTCNGFYSPNWGDVWYVFTAAQSGLYKFSFTRTGYEPGADYFIYSGTCGALVPESSYCGSTNDQIFTMDSGESFYIMVRSGDDGPGIDFGLCVYQLPAPAVNNDCSTPTALLESTDATGDNMISGDFANSYPSSEACDTYANGLWYSFTPTYTGLYHFNLSNFLNYTIYNTDDCSLTSNNLVPDTYCYNSGEVAADFVAGNTYLISIHSYDNATTFDLLAYPDASLSVESQSFETFKYYPNPVVNTFTVEAKNMISSISVFNIVGQKVKLVSPNSLKTTIDMDALENGVYFVTLTIDGAQKTIKVIKK